MDNVLWEVAADAIRRISRRSAAWWRTEIGQGSTRADVIERLVGDLAELGQRAEGITPTRRPPKPARESALVDQLAVVTYDIGDDTTGATAAALTMLALYEVDPRPVATSALALAARLDGALRERLERLPRAGDL